MKIIFIFLLLFPMLLYSINTLEKIDKLDVNIDQSFKHECAVIIKEYSDLYGIDENIVLSIFKVESNFNPKAVNYDSRDFGIGQINAINMKHHNIDLGKLMNDLRYAIGFTYILLDGLQKVYKKDDEKWWSRYHSFKGKYRKIYEEKIDVYLDLLKGVK